MALKALSGVTQGASSFARLPNGFKRSSKLTQTLPIDGVNKATVRVVIGATASGNGVFNGSATASVTITASANGQQTDQQHAGVATVNVAITASASGTATGSSTAHSGTASCQVNLSASAAGFNTSTQIPDETTNSNVMELLNSPTLTTDSAVGSRAVAFDPSGSAEGGRIDTNYESTFQSPFSLSVWTKPDDGILAGDNQYIFSAYSGNVGGVENWRWDLRQIGGKIRAGVVNYPGSGSQNESIKETTANAYSDGAQSSYTHIAVTFNSSAVPTIYVNGTAVTLTTVASASLSLSNYDSTNDCVSVGGIFTSSSDTSPIYSYDGKLDDISLWSTELSSTEVSNLYNSGSGTDLTGSSDLEGWWKMGDSNVQPVTHTGTATASVAITATASGSAYTVHSGTASCQVNLSASASGTATSPWTDTYSIDLDGTNDYVAVSGFDGNALIGTGDMTAAFWVKYDTAGGSNQNTFYIGKIGASEDYILVRQNGSTSKIELYCRNNTGTTVDAVITASSTVTTDTWYHVVFTRTGTTGALYINATSQGSLTDSDFGTDLASSGSGLRLGSFQTGTGTVDGHLNDVAIWDEVLTSSEITAIYNSGSPTDLTTDAGNYASSSGLIGYWKFEENSGTSIADSSSNSNAATLTNGPTFSTDVPVAPTWANTYSIALDGSDDYIDVGNFDPNTEIGTGDFTVSLWLKITDTSHHNNILHWRPLVPTVSDNDAFKIQYIYTLNQIRMVWRISSYSNTYATTTLSQDTWYNVIVTRSGTTANIYLNNAGNASVTATDVGHDFTSADHILGVNDTGGGSTSFEGNIDEYAIWDRVITSTERATVYNSGTPNDLATEVSSGLVGYWRFEENSGTSIADSSTNSNTATLTNGPTFSTDVPVAATWANDYSIDLDGTNDHLSTSLVTDTYDLKDGFSASLWVKLDDVSTTQDFFGRYGASTGRFYFGITGTKVRAAVGNAYDTSTLSHGMSTGTWYHVAYTFSGGSSGTFTYYLNGSSVGTISFTWTTDSGSYEPMHIGGLKNGSNVHQNPTNGKLDELALYSSALSGSDITAIYNSGAPADQSSDSDLVAYWRMEENTGTTVADSSSNSNTATLTNGPTFSTDTP